MELETSRDYWGRNGDAMRLSDRLRRKVPDMTVKTFVDTRPQHSVEYRDLIIEALLGTGFDHQ